MSLTSGWQGWVSVTRERQRREAKVERAASLQGWFFDREWGSFSVTVTLSPLAMVVAAVNCVQLVQKNWPQEKVTLQSQTIYN